MSTEVFPAQLRGFEVLDAQSHTRTSTSAALHNPLRLKFTFTVSQPVVADDLFVSVDFVADVASAQPAVALLSVRAVTRAEGATNAVSAASAAQGSATLSASSPATHESDTAPWDSTSAHLLLPHVEYSLCVAVTDLSALRIIPLKHLLQVSMMCVRVTAAAAAGAESRHAVGAWNVVWQVRRDPQNDQELVRTVLSPLV